MLRWRGLGSGLGHLEIKFIHVDTDSFPLVQSWDQWCPPTRVGKAPNKPSVLKAVLVKIVTEILFGQCTFSKSRQTTVLAADHRPAQ